VSESTRSWLSRSQRAGLRGLAFGAEMPDEREDELVEVV
jgi:hypothetical protein